MGGQRRTPPPPPNVETRPRTATCGSRACDVRRVPTHRSRLRRWPRGHDDDDEAGGRVGRLLAVQQMNHQQIRNSTLTPSATPCVRAYLTCPDGRGPPRGPRMGPTVVESQHGVRDAGRRACGCALKWHVMTRYPILLMKEREEQNIRKIRRNV